MRCCSGKRFLARFVAYTLAHETVHALVAGVLSGGPHNQPPLASDLMNEVEGYVSAGVGLDSNGWVLLAAEEKMFRLQPSNQALMDLFLPVPPTFR